METIGIRVDVNEMIATGHFMRCATINEQLQRMGYAAVFISADTQIIPFVKERGLEYHILHTDWRHLDKETQQLVSYLKGAGITRLLVDSYMVTEAYLQILADAGINVMYLDDLNAMHYPVKALVNYSPGCREINYEEEYSNTGVKLMLGADYVPLRAQFREHTKDYMGRNAVRRIFLTTGGSDPMGITELLIRNILAEPFFADVTIHILAGRFFHASEELFGEHALFGKRVILHQNVSNVAEIMASCDMGITPAGTTLYELSACGVPAVSFVFADNQESDALSFNQEKLIPYAGDFRDSMDVCCLRIITELKKIASLSVCDYKALCAKLCGTVDAKGAERIAQALANL